MDDMLEFSDRHFLTPYIYPVEWTEDSWTRQFLSLMFLLTFNGYLFYLATAGFSYVFIFDKRLLKHPLILENQVWKEIRVACASVPIMAFLSIPFFLLEARGHSQLYNSVQESSFGWPSIFFSTITFILFTDCLSYWTHRALHTRFLYKRLHKAHHLIKVPTPFASHAFHPVDGFVQGLPYHIYIFLFPMHKYVFLVLFLVVNIWTVSIHDGDFRVPLILRSLINGSAHHSDHHMYYNFNYGQFFTFWDKIGGSYREPSAFSGDSPLDQLLKKGILHKKQK